LYTFPTSGRERNNSSKNFFPSSLFQYAYIPKIQRSENKMRNKKLFTIKSLVAIKATVANGFSTPASSIRGIKAGTTYVITTNTAITRKTIIIIGYVSAVLMVALSSWSFLSSKASEERDHTRVHDFSHASIIEVSEFGNTSGIFFIAL
jgi:hypothetical protein